jgi:foldase protein PrsA
LRVSRVQLVLLAALVALVAAACGSSSKSSETTTTSAVPDGVAAKVGPITIPKDRLDVLMNEARIVYGKSSQPFPKPGSISYRLLRGRATAYLVAGAIYEAKAQAEGITATPAEVKAAVQQMKEAQYGKTPAAQAKAMKAQGMTENELEAEARVKAVEGEVQKRIESRVKVTDADVERYYKANKSKFTIPESRDIRQIIVGSAKLAGMLRDRALAGSDFGALAKKYSTDKPTARNGGWVAITKGQTIPAFDKVAFSIPTGKVSNLIPTAYGWQILQAVSPVKPPVVTPLADVRADLKRQLLGEREQAAVAKWQLAAKRQLCGGKIAYDAAYKPSPEDNPCSRQAGSVSAAQPSPSSG